MPTTYDNYQREATASQSVIPASQTLTFAAAQTCNFNSGRVASVTMTSNFTSLTLSGGVAGGLYCLRVAQDATGSRTLSGAASSIIWQGTTLYGATHTAPTLTTTASKIDVFWFYYDGTSYYELFRSMSNAA